MPDWIGYDESPIRSFGEGKMATELGTGSRVGDYILERKLGGGSFGAVWLARHAEDGSTVAIKLLTGAQATDDRAAVRAEVELLAASASSRSRHVVRVLGGGVEPVPYIVMEYVEGRDLSQVLAERGTLPPAEVVPLAVAIADALQALMEAGIIHRDVKPANVLIDNDGTAKLADFGIAKIVGMDTVTMTGQLPMTMAYAAPEVWDGHVSHQSDLYALGAVLYQCLAGAPPFSGNYGALYKAHATEMPDFDRLPAETPPTLCLLITRCLEKAQTDRPADADVVLGFLHRAAAELTAPPTPDPTHFGPWRRRAPHPTQRWAWRCVHDETGQTATVEVHSFQTLTEGERLRHALSANGELAAYGAERLLETSRLLLRPGEQFVEEPAAPFLFWVARDELTVSPPAGELSTFRLRKVVEALAAMLTSASAAGVELSFDAPNLVLLADGSPHVRRPGLAAPIEDPGTAALAFLREQPLDDDARALVERAGDLDELARIAAVGAMPFGVARAAADAVPGRTSASASPSIAGVGQPERYVAPPRSTIGGGGEEPPVVATGLAGLGDWMRRHRLVLAAVGGIAAVMLVATVLASWPDEQSKTVIGPPGGTATRTLVGATATNTPTTAEAFLHYCATQLAGPSPDPACNEPPTGGSGPSTGGTGGPGGTNDGENRDTNQPPGSTPSGTVLGTSFVPEPTPHIDPLLPVQPPGSTPASDPTSSTSGGITPIPPASTFTPTPTVTLGSITIGTDGSWEAYNDPTEAGNGNLGPALGNARVVCERTGCPGSDIAYGWTGDGNWPTIATAKPIWRPGITAASSADGGGFYFVRSFTFSGLVNADNYRAVITFSADDGMRVWIDGHRVDPLPGVNAVTLSTWDVPQYFDGGYTHEIKIWGANAGCNDGCTYKENPAMVELSLEITPK